MTPRWMKRDAWALFTLKLLLGLLVWLVSSLPASLALAETWHVPSDAKTIQAGIDSTATGDSVLVAPGYYKEALNFNGKGISLVSEGGAGQTTIDASGFQSSVITLEQSEPVGTLIEGFGITGGNSANGGGIFAPNSSPTIRRNIVFGNVAHSGGGIRVGSNDLAKPWPSPSIEENEIFSNEAELVGGGLLITGTGNVDIRDNFIHDNSTVIGDGGGIFLDLRGGAISVIDNIISRNVAEDQGGGMHGQFVSVQKVSAAVVDIVGNLIAENSALGVDGPDHGSGGGLCIDRLEGTVQSNTIVRNIGNGESPCSGGGLRLIRTGFALNIGNNIIALNEGCGVACWGPSWASVGRNLFWRNGISDIGTNEGECFSKWAKESLIADPYFCDAEGGDYRLATNSPALTGESIIGAFPNSGCAKVSVDPTSWGLLKLRFQ